MSHLSFQRTRAARTQKRRRFLNDSVCSSGPDAQIHPKVRPITDTDTEYVCIHIHIGMCARATHIVWPFSYLPLSKATPDFQRLINGGAHITNLGFGWEATYMYIYKHMYTVHIYREAYLNEVGWDKEERSLSSTVREKVSQRYLFPIGNPLSIRSESPSQILFPDTQLAFHFKYWLCTPQILSWLLMFFCPQILQE